MQYAGDSGNGPKPSALRSRRFEALVSAVLDELEKAVAGAELLSHTQTR